MMGAEKFYDAITEVREDLVEEALDYRFPQKKPIPWQRYVPLAACLALVVCIGYLAANLRMGGMNTAGGNDGSDNSAASGESTGDAADGALPGDDSGTTTDGALPPPNDMGSDGGGSGGAVAGSVPALGLAAEVEGLTAVRELTLEFAGDGTVYATDVYTLTNAGTEPVTAALTFDGEEVSCTVDGAAVESGAHVSLLNAGASAEIVLRSKAAVEGDTLALDSPVNLTVAEAALVLWDLPEGTVVSGTEPFDQIIQE